jgi:hypothetical protein
MYILFSYRPTSLFPPATQLPFQLPCCLPVLLTLPASLICTYKSVAACLRCTYVNVIIKTRLQGLIQALSSYHMLTKLGDPMFRSTSMHCFTSEGWPHLLELLCPGLSLKSNQGLQVLFSHISNTAGTVRALAANNARGAQQPWPIITLCSSRPKVDQELEHQHSTHAPGRTRRIHPVCRGHERGAR